MRTQPAALTNAAVLAEVAPWGIAGRSAVYLAVGGGAHHWRVVDSSGACWFVTVDDLTDKDWLGGEPDAVHAGLGQALTVSAILREDAGLDFVVAPERDCDGALLRRLDDRYAISVFAHLDGESFAFAHAPPDDRHRRDLLRMLGAMRESTPAVRDVAASRPPKVGHRPDLEVALTDPDDEWTSGPFGEAAWEAFRPFCGDVASLLAGFDVLAADTGDAETVITHGEPHPGNTMLVGNRLMLLDWDTVGLAVAERDLWMVVGDGAGVGDPERLVMYRLRWFLDDMASAVARFRLMHDDDPDSRRWMEGLYGLLREVPDWKRRMAMIR